MYVFINIDKKMATSEMSKHDANIFCSGMDSFVVSPDWLLSANITPKPGFYWTEYQSFRLPALNNGIS